LAESDRGNIRRLDGVQVLKPKTRVAAKIHDE
jgi:hypothetical protein